MPSKKFLAPVVWTRPRCAIYNDNYRFGDSLIRGGLDTVEKKYFESMARTEFRSLNRAKGASYDSGLPLSHSYSSASLPPRPITPTNSSLKRSKSVIRPKSVMDDMPIEPTLLRRRSTRKRPETVHFASPLTPASTTVEAHSQLIYLDRCRELTTEIERLNSALLDSETKIKQEAAHIKTKLHTEVQTLQFAADEQERNLEELRNLCKKQQRQIQELHSSYENMSRNYDLAVDELQNIQRKALSICNEVDTMRASLDRIS